jgi:hypothetical protein
MSVDPFKPRDGEAPGCQKHHRESCEECYVGALTETAVSEPEERIAAAIRVCRRIENEAHAPACRGLFTAQGQRQAAEYVRELLEQPLPEHPSEAEAGDERG